MDLEDQNMSSDSQQSLLCHRRPAAHESVSLLHPPRSSQQQPQHPRKKSTAGFAAEASSTVTQPVNKHRSRENSNAARWFEKSNNNVKTRVAELDDNDPPFFLRHSSSSEASPDMATAAQSQPNNAAMHLPIRAPSLFPTHDIEDSSDEFRSVIDDLTIENKKLRMKLRKYEQQNDSQLQADKLFEVRIHRLPAEKRRELEETLQNFATSLEEAPSMTKISGETTARFAAKLQTASSLANTDSAYASMSGHNQSLHSGGDNNVRPLPQPGMSQEQQQTIQSYLHEIPAGLFPKHQVVMTEKTKRKLVVRRMEQIFAGKGATDSGHQQPIQQQEVSKSAAHADRVVQGREGQEHDREGAREARIVPIAKRHGESKTTETNADYCAESLNHMEVDVRNPNGEEDGNDSPGQRPTRPLDLDPHRAQVPSDNIKYMRHLGFSPPEAGAAANLADDHGWVYLNVLTNMAQLHTINVTVDFVKRSISEYSDKFELSPDGRKVRWKGGVSLTRISTDGSPDERGTTKTTGKATHVPQLQAGMISQSVITETANKLAYVPLFFRQEDSTDSDEGESAVWTSPARVNAAVTTALEGEGQLLSSPRRRRGDDGPIIFYNKARFFTDLSGDKRGYQADSGDVRHYSTNSLRPVGLSRGSSLDEDQCIQNVKKGPLSKEGVVDNAVDVDQLSDLASGLSRPTSSRTSSFEDGSPVPIEFEVSGIGGVQPSDNFAINIRSRKRLAPKVCLPGVSGPKTKFYTSRIQSVLAETHLEPSRSNQAKQQTVVDEIITAERKDLPTSRLPDPSFYHFAADGEDSEDSLYDSDDDSSISSVSSVAQQTAHRAVPTSAPQLTNWTPRNMQPPSLAASCVNDSHDGTEDQDMDDDDSDDGSIDMLAQARAIDPNLIRAKEREYDGGIADRLAEEIPAGSSAATAGGGSGFNSPQLYHAGKKVPSLKRTRDENSASEKVRAKSPKVEE